MTITDDRTRALRQQSQRGKVKLLAALVVVALALGARSFLFSTWYQEWRFGRMSLAALQSERGGRLDNPRLLYQIGLRLNQQGRYAEADAYLRNAVGLSPDEARLRAAWAESLLRTGRITAAFGELSQFAGTHPQSPLAHLMLGRFYASQESMARAVEELTRAVTLDASLPEGWTALAAAQSANGSVPQAVQSAERAAQLRPKDSQAHLGLALLLQENGQTERARRAFVETLALAPDFADAHREYARCLLEGNASASDLRQAETEARRALQLAPSDMAASLVMGKALLAAGKPAGAIPFLRRAAEASPYDHPSAFLLMQTYTRLKQQAEAARWERLCKQRYDHVLRKQQLVTAIQKTPAAAQPHREMARLLAEEGDTAGCIRHDAEALHCAPDAPPALIAAADHLLAAGRASNALPVVQRAVEEAANNPMARETLGNILLALGRPQEAAQAYAKASHGFPDRLNLYQKRLDDEYARLHGGIRPNGIASH